MASRAEQNGIAVSALQGGDPARATGTAGMAATAFPSATEAALAILRSGGNAIDAAVAAAWALAVCEPSGSGLGGQTTILIRLASGRTCVVDGHSRAPGEASTKTISKAQQAKGYRACTIPSTPATLDYTLRQYGTLHRAKVMEPAIRLAQEGYPVTKLHCRQLKWCQEDLAACPAAGRLFLHGPRPFKPGEVFRQPELAATLGRLAQVGVQDFYQGRIAHAIAEDMQAHGGLLTEQDLGGCGFPLERSAVTVGYRGWRLTSVPPPGGGLQFLLGMKVLGQFAPEDLGADLDRWYEIMAEVTYAVFMEPDRIVVHPKDLTPSLLQWLLSDERAAEIAQRIRAGSAVPEPAEAEGAGDTTHLCTVDGQGNCVALTQSIQSLFGAKVAHGQLGFLYNNYLCTCKRRKHPYQLVGRCIPRSNVAPTLVWREADPSGRPCLVLGAAGSRRITSAILHVLSGVLDRGLSLADAVGQPRVHGLLGRRVRIERPIAVEPLLGRLAGRFRAVEVKARHSYTMGCVQAIQIHQDRALTGAADPRRDGTAEGLS